MNMTEGRRDGGFILSEAHGNRSRESVTLAMSATPYEPGSVLTRDAGLTVTKTDVGGGKGAITLASPAFGSGVKLGVYKVVIIEPAANAGTFQVEDPDGIIVGTGNVAVAFDGPVKFTLADATDFVSGDMATITVSGGKYTLATDADLASAILLLGTNATAGDRTAAVMARDCEVNGAELVYGSDVNDAAKRANKAAQLAAVGIIVR